MIRLFAAIPIPTAIKKQISGACGAYSVENWTPEANMHLTVHFFGNTSADDLPLVAAKLKAITLSLNPFELYFKEVVAITENRQKAMVWIRFLPQETLSLMASLIAEVSGRESDFDFTPHLTLLRLPDGKDQADKARQLAKIQVAPFGFTVKYIELWNSVHDGRQGRKYSCLQRFYLANGG